MKDHSPLLRQLSQGNLDPIQKTIAEKVLDGKRITDAEALHLYEHGDLPFLSMLANEVGAETPAKRPFSTAISISSRRTSAFIPAHTCAYSEKIKKRSDGWELSLDQIMHQVKAYDGKPVTEVHIVGGVMPQYDHQFYQDLFSAIRKHHRAAYQGIDSGGIPLRL